MATPAEFCTLVGCLKVARKDGIKVDLSDCSNTTIIEHKTLEDNIHLLEEEVFFVLLYRVVHYIFFAKLFLAKFSKKLWDFFNFY